MAHIDSDSLFVVSGGARGITAQCVIQMAARYRCSFILLGRSSFAGTEPPWTEGCVDEAELKARIIEALTTRGKTFTPRSIRAHLKTLLSRREIGRTLRAIEEHGGRAQYLSADITCNSSLKTHLGAALKRLGRATGLIHGAGALADKLIERKSEADFETVYAPKVEGLVNLLDCLSVEQLDYLILFSSAAGFYGNAGQADYAMANEILNKAAHIFKSTNPDCRVLSLNWGPWDAGMVTPEMKELFARRNIRVIPTEDGTRAFLDELEATVPRPVQILVGGGMGSSNGPVEPGLRSYRIRRKLTLDENPFLKDHVIAGKPVLPAVCAVLWMANTCEQLYPGYRFYQATNYKVLKGIVFDNTLASEYLLDLEETAKRDSGEIDFTAVLWSRTAAGAVCYHGKAELNLRKNLPPSPVYESFDSAQETRFRGSSPYRDGTLFHGPTFQGVRRILNLNAEKVTLECQLPRVDEKAQGQFPDQAFNPYAADAAVQGMVIWARHRYGAGSLPSGLRRAEYFHALAFDEPFYVSMEVEATSPQGLKALLFVHDAEGRVHSRITGAQVTISEGLNPFFVSSANPNP